MITLVAMGMKVETKGKVMAMVAKRCTLEE
jgi:hypothetical protein